MPKRDPNRNDAQIHSVRADSKRGASTSFVIHQLLPANFFSLNCSMLLQNKFFTIALAGVLLFASCKSKKEPVQQKEPEPAKTEEGAALASNEANIVATVVLISEQRDESGPCAKAPCHAEIKIESISKRGSLFQLDDISKPISVNFAFSLSPTVGLFRMPTNYPGLEINDKFEAKIQSKPALGDTITYTVHGYKKIE